MPKLKVDGLRKLKEHKNEEIKQLAVVELAKRGELDESELGVLINDSDAELGYWGYRALIDRGKKFNIEEVRKNWPRNADGPRYPSLLTWYLLKPYKLEELAREILKTYSTEELTECSKWLSLDNELAYLELGLRNGPEVLKQVRKDLEDKFGRIKKVYRDELNNLLLASKEIGQTQNVITVQALIDKFDKESQEYGENRFTKSALKILIRHGEKEDIRFAKQFMASNEQDIKGIATELFVNVADKGELPMLVEIALNSSGEIKEKAARKALAIDEEGSVLEAFLKSNSSVLIKLYFKEKLKKGLLLEKEKIEQLLLNADEDVRGITVAYLMKALGQRRAKLEQILDKYLENKTYYYNTVCWLDRILYAPRKFRELYRKQLSAKLDE